jgi:hypothetical protein
MSHTARIKMGDRKGKTTVLVCGNCGRDTTHEILLNLESEDQTPDREIQWSESYLTVQCRGCATVSFCIESSNSEDFDQEDPSRSLIRRRLYPNRIPGRTALEDLDCLPPKLQQVYEETRLALTEDLAVLTGIGIRAIVETVCNENRASGRNLFQKITGLVKAGLISLKEAEILHALRFMGNEAAHNVKAHTQAELNIALDVVEHLLKTVYILPQQTKRLPKEPKQPGKPQSTKR